MNPKNSTYHQYPRFLTEDELNKYIRIKHKKKPTNVSSVKNLRIVDYTERKNRI